MTSEFDNNRLHNENVRYKYQWIETLEVCGNPAHLLETWNYAMIVVAVFFFEIFGLTCYK